MAALALHAERAGPRMFAAWTLPWRWPPQHRVKLQLVNAVLLGGLVVVSVYLTTAIGHSEQNIAFSNPLGQVLRAIDLPLKVGGRRQPGWRCARAVRLASRKVRARIAAPSSDTPTCLDSSGKGKVIDFFVVSEELLTFVRTVAVDDKLPRIAPVGPSRRPPSYVEVLEMLSGSRNARTPWCAQRWTRRCNGDARWKRKSSAVATLSTRKSTQAG